ncbi:hypothetical protein CDD82_1886 [Ophiocordyceps australis]|uniref:Uncharacterized protein n=1 Tax=Ophiocordyceps australis TaxID=1399860 RepID=A0A2C5Y781_9HYPO|nr:hypothetical protein CDD82_1886 [Ophiocordyceps australis]
MGSSCPAYSVPLEAKKLLLNEILGNPLMPRLPPELNRLASLVAFDGSDLPSIPVNWRWAESMAALKGFEATMVNLLLARKYGIEPVEVKINT